VNTNRKYATSTAELRVKITLIR